MDIYEYYVLDADNKPKKTSRAMWEAWMRNNVRRVCVAETHLMYNGQPATVITTRFTGVDTQPYGLCDPYLWETKVAYFHGEELRHATYHEAKRRHEEKVTDVIILLKRDNFIVTRKDIDLSIHQNA